MAAPTHHASKLHAPARGGDYRSYLYEARTLCRRTGWVALAEGQVTCSACLRRLQRRRARARRDAPRRDLPRWDAPQGARRLAGIAAAWRGRARAKAAAAE